MPAYRFPKLAVAYWSVCHAVARLPSFAKGAASGSSPCPMPEGPNAAALTGVSVRLTGVSVRAGTAPEVAVFGAGGTFLTCPA